MLANADGVMPEALMYDADQRFFEAGLDGVDVAVHGRHSQEQQPRSPLRHRLILTRRIAAIAAHPSEREGAVVESRRRVTRRSLARARRAGCGHRSGRRTGRVRAVPRSIRGLSSVAGARSASARRASGLSGVPDRTPEEILAAHDLVADPVRLLDPAKGTHHGELATRNHWLISMSLMMARPRHRRLSRQIARRDVDAGPSSGMALGPYHTPGACAAVLCSRRSSSLSSGASAADQEKRARVASAMDQSGPAVAGRSATASA